MSLQVPIVAVFGAEDYPLGIPNFGREYVINDRWFIAFLVNLVNATFK